MLAAAAPTKSAGALAALATLPALATASGTAITARLPHSRETQRSLQWIGLPAARLALATLAALTLARPTSLATRQAIFILRTPLPLTWSGSASRRLAVIVAR